jgi:hypothetical protein
MDLLWVICLLGGLFALVASVKNWDWFFTNRKTRFFVTLFGRTGARIVYALLGVFLVVLGSVSIIRDIRQTFFTGKGPVVVVTTSYQGADARKIASIIAGPIEAQIAQIGHIDRIESESRSDGSYVARFQMRPGTEPPMALAEVEARVVRAQAVLPADSRQGDVEVKLTPIDEWHTELVSIALVSRDDEGAEKSLQEFAAKVAKRLIDEGAIVKPEPLDDQQGTDEAGPTLIIRVDKHPALRITGSPPEGKTAYMAAVRCVELAIAERTKRLDAESFEVVNLTSR